MGEHEISRFVAKARALRRSMFGQMAILTAIFLGWGVYTFGLRPFLDMPNNSAELPLALTSSELQQVLGDFVVSARDSGSSDADLTDNPVIRRIVAANPHLRYHAQVRGRTFGNSPGHFLQSFGVAGVVAALVKSDNPDLCAQMSKPFGRPNTAFASLSMCGSALTYYEFSGLERPALHDRTEPFSAVVERFWSYYSSFFLPAVGVFVIFVLVMLIHMAMIRRFARMAASIDPDDLYNKLPERGVASEFVPVIRGINNMISRAEETQRRNAFFLSAAAHEMRTPLTVLRTRLEMLDEGKLKDKLVGDLRRLINLVNQLLALMTIQEREASGVLDLIACCRAAISENEPVAAAAGVHLRFETDHATWETAGNATLARSAIGNLIANAISFSPPESTILISLEGDGAVTVRDHGPGISHQDPATLFEPFVRAPVNRRGFGLGLAIVKAVATLHGGTVGAGNVPDGGAWFTVTFPLKAEA